MAAIEVDPERVTAYAKAAAKAATDLSTASGHLTDTRLTGESFGDLGKTVRSTEAYSRASSLLLGQLTRAVEALHAASEGLDKVAESHRGADDESAQRIKRTHEG